VCACGGVQELGQSEVRLVESAGLVEAHHDAGQRTLYINMYMVISLSIDYKGVWKTASGALSPINPSSAIDCCVVCVWLILRNNITLMQLMLVSLYLCVYLCSGPCDPGAAECGGHGG
jgi:hypothetical protein